MKKYLFASLLVAGFLGSTVAGFAQDKPKVAFIPGISSDPYFKAMEIGARAKAEELGIDLIWQGSASEYSPQSQLPFVNAALAEDIKALILVPTDPDALMPSVTKAEALSIPVITVDQPVSDRTYITSTILGDNHGGGALAAKTLAEQIGGAGKVFIISGSPSATTDVVREQGFRDEIEANYPDIEIIGREYSNSQPAQATSAVSTVLLANPDLKGIFALNGTSGVGSIAALRNNNAVGTVKLIGYDAYPAQVEALKEGVFSALIAQRPGMEAEIALEAAYAVITGEGVDAIKDEVVIGNIVMTQDNLAETEIYTYAE